MPRYLIDTTTMTYRSYIVDVADEKAAADAWRGTAPYTEDVDAEAVEFVTLLPTEAKLK